MVRGDPAGVVTGLPDVVGCVSASVAVAATVLRKVWMSSQSASVSSIARSWSSPRSVVACASRCKMAWPAVMPDLRGDLPVKVSWRE